MLKADLAIYGLMAALLLLATSCGWFDKNERENDPIVAEVGNKYLYASDIGEMVGKGLSTADSAEVTRNFIDTWIRKQLILQLAEKYLSAEELDIERRVQDYRESLIIYNYENALIQQKMDTVVTDEEIEAYYDQYAENFLLPEDIAQFYYIKWPKDAPKIEDARKMFRSSAVEDREQLKGYCVTYASEFYLDDSIWYELSGIYKQIPIDQLQLRTLSKNRLSGEVEDSLYIYMLKVNNFKEQQQPAPLNYVKDDVTKIILNKRKMTLINETYENLYKDALENGDFKKH